MADTPPTDHTVTITAPNGATWTWLVDVHTATGIWRFLDTPDSTCGFGAERRPS